ncbi:MAG: hypothetical protein L6R37_005037 [Teloschistes peruensis]|nr:MAG: hypothetical protein L6R37_005037 [Teloschistes peruensis]
MAVDSDDEMEYLSPSFDPSTLTVPRLRSTLLAHDIPYPPTAKKPQLVELFNEELKPRSRKILVARARVRRTSRGITDMPSSQEGTVDDEDEDGRTESMPPPPVPNISRRKPRKSSRQPSEDPAANQTSNATAQKSSIKHPRPSDTEASETEIKRPAARKTRRSEVVPVARADEAEEKPVRPTLEKSPFSDENPFQSGSSPLAPSDGRRRTAGVSADRRKSTSRRRKTEGISSGAKDQAPQQDGVVVPSSKTFDISVTRSNQAREQDEPESEVEAGEEFTPTEQLELVKDRAANGGHDLLPARKRTRSRNSSGGTIPRSAPWMVIIALFSGYALWYSREQTEIGYCGVGRPSTNSIAGLQIPEWANALQPECKPCPQHAYCYEDMDARCEADFVLVQHPLSLGGMLPLPPTCEPDGEKARKVKMVADRAIEELRERNAGSECGTLTDEQGKIVQTPEINEQDLKKQVAAKRRKGMSDYEFEDLWKGALGEIVGREEIVQSSIFFYLRNRFITRRSDNARVPSLVSMALDRLATQAALYNRGDALESWISVGQLRDDVLREEFSAKRREGLWRRVEEVVEMNANVRASERELRAGDVSRVWEWIGNLGLMDDVWAEGGRRSGVRFSLGERRRDSFQPNGRASMGLGNEGRNEVVEKRQWDEGRPIY